MKPTTRRDLLSRSATLALLLTGPRLAGAVPTSIVAVRMWPADEYSRVTIESSFKLKVTQTVVESPPRLAVDIAGLVMDPRLREILGKVQPDDPFISGIRVAQFAPDVVRMVIDLKQPIEPRVFTLAPVANYKYRLVFDLYPTHPIDPMEKLIADLATDSRPGVKEAAIAEEAALAQTPPPPGTAAHDPLDDWFAQRGSEIGSPPGGAPPAAVAGGPPPAAAAPGPRPKPAPPTVAAAPPPKAAPPVVASAPPPPAATPTRGKTERVIIVAIDPGHGGEDPGATGPTGLREKDVVLRIALALRDRINRASVGGNPMRAFLTRDSDFFVPLGTRVAKARRVQADLFISIHADAFTRSQANGSSVYALSERGASSAAARWLANKENESDLVGGVDVRSQDRHVQAAMLDMSTSAQIKDSIKLAGSMLHEIGGVNRLHKSDVEQAGFAVLKSPEIPSILIETAFISNPEEENKLRTAAHQQALANAIMRGITRYFAANPPLARTRQI